MRVYKPEEIKMLKEMGLLNRPLPEIEFEMIRGILLKLNIGMENMLKRITKLEEEIEQILK